MIPKRQDGKAARFDCAIRRLAAGADDLGFFHAFLKRAEHLLFCNHDPTWHLQFAKSQEKYGTEARPAQILSLS
jgi:hypothetical protein